MAVNTYLWILNLVTIMVNYKGQWKKSQVVFAMVISS